MWRTNAPCACLVRAQFGGERRCPIPQTILLIEDDRGSRVALAALLLDAGYTVTAVATGQAGLDAFAKGQPDLVITDYALPDFTAPDLLSAFIGTPVIVVSGAVALRQADEGVDFACPGSTLAAGPAIHYLPKPIDVEALLRLLAKLLS